MVYVARGASNVKVLALKTPFIEAHVSVQHEHAFITNSPGGLLEFIIWSRDEVSQATFASVGIPVLVNDNLISKWPVKHNVITWRLLLRLCLRFLRWCRCRNFSHIRGSNRFGAGLKAHNKVSSFALRWKASTLELILEFGHGVQLPIDYFIFGAVFGGLALGRHGDGGVQGCRVQCEHNKQSSETMLGLTKMMSLIEMKNKRVQAS